jgi:pyruvate ferredoxin oxidoreductase alpha subunit
MGAFAMPELYTEVKMAHQAALTNAYGPILEVWQEWGELTGRHYRPVETYRTEGAKVIIMMMGSLAEVAETAVDAMREKGDAVGLVKIRLWRPFPFAELRQALAGAELVIVCDRALSLGGAAGPVLAEVRSAMYPMADRPQILGYTVGLGGRDVQPEAFAELVRHARVEAQQGPSQEFYIYGVRG